jgi:diguanylate cyclase (GGDEF)-like protein
MPSILVVENENVITREIQAKLGCDGYRTILLFDGDDIIQCVLREIPSLVILDATLVGCETARIIQRLRDHPKCMHIPIMVVSAQVSLREKIHAYEIGVDSYLVKPLNLEELLAHTKRHLMRMQQSTLSPLTYLPGGLQVEHVLENKICSREPWSILYLDLDNFKAFNDIYGFLVGNGMIMLVGNVCQEVVYEYGNADDFVGHIGGDDFVVVTTPDREKLLCHHILTRYKQESIVLYHRSDLERGTISGVDRKGRPFQFPLVTLSIGVVSDYSCCTHAVSEISYLTAEAKRRAKQSSNNISHIAIDWRQPLIGHAPISYVSYPYNLLGQGQRKLFHTSEEDMLARFQ